MPLNWDDPDPAFAIFPSELRKQICRMARAVSVFYNLPLASIVDTQLRLADCMEGNTLRFDAGTCFTFHVATSAPDLKMYIIDCEYWPPGVGQPVNRWRVLRVYTPIGERNVFSAIPGAPVRDLGDFDVFGDAVTPPITIDWRPANAHLPGFTEFVIKHRHLFDWSTVQFAVDHRNVSHRVGETANLCVPVQLFRHGDESLLSSLPPNWPSKTNGDRAQLGWHNKRWRTVKDTTTSLWFHPAAPVPYLHELKAPWCLDELFMLAVRTARYFGRSLGVHTDATRDATRDGLYLLVSDMTATDRDRFQASLTLAVNNLTSGMPFECLRSDDYFWPYTAYSSGGRVGLSFAAIASLLYDYGGAFKSYIRRSNEAPATGYHPVGELEITGMADVNSLPSGTLRLATGTPKTAGILLSQQILAASDGKLSGMIAQFEDGYVRVCRRTSRTNWQPAFISLSGQPQVAAETSTEEATVARPLRDLMLTNECPASSVTETD